MPYKTILRAIATIAIILVSLNANSKTSEMKGASCLQRIEGNLSDDSLKPVIESVSDLTFHWEKYEFSLEFTVQFHGTDHINVFLEEDNNTTLRDYYFEGPGKVHVKTGKLSRLVFSRVSIKALNEYGSAEKILEFPAHYPDKDSDSMTIICDDISENGTISAYLSHGFKLDKGNLTVEDPEWTLILPLEDGDSEHISLKDDSFTCTINSFESETGYKVNQEGIMEAVLQFKGTLDDATTVFKHYDILFDFKPFIEYAVIEKIEENEAPFTSYNAYYEVKYYGADHISVYVEEEYGSKLKVNRIYEPLIAHGCSTHITAPYKAWIDFIAENKYGKDIYTIEMLPYGEIANSVEGIIDVTASSGSKANLIEVYDINGRKIADINDASEAYRLQVKGILILKSATGTKKITIR